jgi:hypothetical protein
VGVERLCAARPAGGYTVDAVDAKYVPVRRRADSTARRRAGVDGCRCAGIAAALLLALLALADAQCVSQSQSGTRGMFVVVRANYTHNLYVGSPASLFPFSRS